MNLLDTFFILSCIIQGQAIPHVRMSGPWNTTHAYARFSFSAEFVLLVFLYDSPPPSIPLPPPAVGSKMCSLRIRAACGHFHIRGPVRSAARQARISAVANSEIKLRFYDSIPLGTDRTWQSGVYFCSIGWDLSTETNSEVAKWSTKRHK